MRKLPALLVLFVPLACAKDLKPDDLDPTGGPHFTTTMNADGSSTTVVEATSETDWRYFDLETKKEVAPAMPETSMDWDIAFQRFRVKINGGSSGAGGMELAFLPMVAFESVTEASNGPYTTDRPDSDDADDVPDYAFNQPNAASELGWYLYNVDSHVLMPADVTYVVRTVERGWFKIRFTDYYSGAARSSGYPQFKFDGVAPPSGAGTLQVDVSGTGYKYVSITSKSVVTVADPLTSTAWDLAVDEAGWQTNSGVGRAGAGGARIAPMGTTYETLTESPTTGFVVDRMIPFPGPPGAPMFLGNPVLSDWFVYDTMTHMATSKGLVYLIRTASGDYAKMQILSYDNAAFTYTLRVDPLPKTVNVETAMIDASDAARFTYFNLRLGAPVDIADPSTSKDWDIGFSRTKVRTNSGTSGDGDGGALDPGATMLGAITSAPGAGYEVDRMLPNPDSPGIEYSGNPILSSWYQFTTTATTPKDNAYVVRTADGGFAKLKVTNWSEGMVIFDYAYAGAGETSF